MFQKDMDCAGTFDMQDGRMLQPVHTRNSHPAIAGSRSFSPRDLITYQ